MEYTEDGIVGRSVGRSLGVGVVGFGTIMNVFKRSHSRGVAAAAHRTITLAAVPSKFQDLCAAAAVCVCCELLSTATAVQRHRTMLTCPTNDDDDDVDDVGIWRCGTHEWL